MKIKSKVMIAVCACTMLVGCGSEASSVAYDVVEPAMTFDVAATNGVSIQSYGYGEESYAYDDYEYEYEDSKSDYDEQLSESSQEAVMNKDMLIYTGNVTIKTKKFDEDLAAVKELLASYDCFFENEEMWSDYSYDDKNLNNYSATVRVPSQKYDDLLNGVSGIGTVTNLNSSCENVSAEYSDTIVAIDIYQAERDRYVNLLRTITDDQYAIEVQRELTDIELKLAQYRARKQNIETDVAYSYITIRLNEVREYSQQTVYNDSFIERLKNTVVNTFYGFVTFLEWLLFTLIKISPYAIFFFIVWLILKRTGVILRFKIRTREKKEEKRRKKMIKGMRHSYDNPANTNFKMYDVKQDNKTDKQGE